MTTVGHWPSLSVVAVMARIHREVMAMENARKESPADGRGVVRIADVRNVPLEQLSADAAAAHLVDTVMQSMEGSSRVSVAAFGSAI
jgi:hypothetical protein